MVIGSRVSGERQRGSLTPQQIFGNASGLLADQDHLGHEIHRPWSLSGH